MLHYQLEIVGEEFVTSIGYSDEFYVNLLFDRYIYRPMCTHMGDDTNGYIPYSCHNVFGWTDQLWYDVDGIGTCRKRT